MVFSIELIGMKISQQANNPIVKQSKILGLPNGQTFILTQQASVFGPFNHKNNMKIKLFDTLLANN